MPDAPLHGLRILECSILGPAAVTTHLADLGAEVIKVEPPGGDYVRGMAWPIVDGVSLMHLHLNRGKRSVVLDLREPSGVAAFTALAARSDVVVEAMRPGGLARRGLGFDALRAVNPALVFATVSGFGTTGPLAGLASHGIAFDTWAGVVAPETDADGFPTIPDHVSIGITAGPLFGALGILAAVLRARATGVGARVEVAQSDAAAAFDWLRIEGWRAYRRPADEVTGNPADGLRRRAPGTGGMRESVRYQLYATADGHVLLMASENRFWRNFCHAAGCPELIDETDTREIANHAAGDVALRRTLTALFARRTTWEWVELGVTADVPLAPVNTPRTVGDDPQFVERMPWTDAAATGTEMMPSPIRFPDLDLPGPTTAPALGADTETVLRDVAGYSDAQVAALLGQ
ncbi:CaiB/BaiF CoA transferase family protein [Cryptosporangium arvum]|uniref:CaiB/BaiF CoA transferase family protein n=1 Tax=Cryptosporangium arvum TaxID=80871 RepID=UPI0004AD5BED|nr:CoA transferase [Cryptosporangium arvum]